MSTSKTAKASMGDKGEAGKRYLHGKEVRPIMYVGRSQGHGKYIAGTVDGQLVCDPTGKPIKFDRIGAIA